MQVAVPGAGSSLPPGERAEQVDQPIIQPLNIILSFDLDAAVSREHMTEIGGRTEAQEATDQTVDTALRDEKPTHTILDELRNSPVLRCDDRQPGSHGFLQDIRDTLLVPDCWP
jgi:hypothetical protein